MNVFASKTKSEGTRLRSVVETEKNKRKFRYFVAVVGFVLVAIELVLAFNEVAVYQSLVCSVYLLFNILVDLSPWINRYWVQKYGRKLSSAEGKLFGGIILMPFWLLFNWLLGLIAPSVPQEIIWLYSLAIIIALVIMASVPDYIIRERSFSEKKRSAVRRAIWVSLILVIPYISVISILSVLGVLSHRIQSLTVLAFLPIAFFTIALSGGIAKRYPLEETLEGGIFWVMVTVIPFAVAVFIALPFSYQIPYICVLVVAYVSFVFWLRSVRAKNRQKRERKASKVKFYPVPAKKVCVKVVFDG
jgi:hypothetical protein